MNKFVGNNVVTTEEHLKYFMDMLNDYDVEHEYVVMKLFIQSLVEYARDWYRGLPNASISSWDEFEMCLEEQYGDTTNTSFMLNEFNNIKKSLNEPVTEFNLRFQKAMYKLFQVLRLDENVF